MPTVDFLGLKINIILKFSLKNDKISKQKSNLFFKKGLLYFFLGTILI